jgi:DnaJ-class molecular chaperone
MGAMGAMGSSLGVDLAGSMEQLVKGASLPDESTTKKSKSKSKTKTKSKRKYSEDDAEADRLLAESKLILKAAEEITGSKITEEFEDPSAPAILPRTDDLHHQLNVTLEDLYKGKRKRLTLTRKNFNKETPHQLFDEKKSLIVPIAPGMYEGQQIRFKREADHLPDHEPGDVIITIKEIEHSVFDREDNVDLSIMRNISLSEMYSCTQSFRHLDKRVITIKNRPEDVLFKNEALRKIPGEGMPIYGDPSGKKGDLYIHFNLNMPEKLSEEQIQHLQKVAPPYEYDEDDISNLTEEEKAQTPVVYHLEVLSDEDLQKLHGGYEDYNLYDDVDSSDDSGGDSGDDSGDSGDEDDSGDSGDDDEDEEEGKVVDVNPTPTATTKKEKS